MTIFNPSFSVRVEPVSIQIFKKMEKITEDSRRGIRQAYYRIGKKSIKEISTDILRKPRHGKKYRSRKNGKWRRASVPGEAPAEDTGALRRSLDFNPKGYSDLGLGFDDTVDYGEYLELGTENMEARPGLSITIEKNLNNGSYDKIFEQELKKALIAKGR